MAHRVGPQGVHRRHAGIAATVRRARPRPSGAADRATSARLCLIVCMPPYTQWGMGHAGRPHARGPRGRRAGATDRSRRCAADHRRTGRHREQRRPDQSPRQPAGPAQLDAVARGKHPGHVRGRPGCTSRAATSLRVSPASRVMNGRTERRPAGTSRSIPHSVHPERGRAQGDRSAASPTARCSAWVIRTEQLAISLVCFTIPQQRLSAVIALPRIFVSWLTGKR
jgi:hypothetical protein